MSGRFTSGDVTLTPERGKKYSRCLYSAYSFDSTDWNSNLHLHHVTDKNKDCCHIIGLVSLNARVQAYHHITGILD